MPRHISLMLKLTPILLAIGYALLSYQFSSWRLKRELDERSTRLADPRLREISKRMAKVLDLEDIPVPPPMSLTPPPALPMRMRMRCAVLRPRLM